MWARAAGRPTWKARNRDQTEAFFLESLSAWRNAMGIDKMVLVCILPKQFTAHVRLPFCALLATYAGSGHGQRLIAALVTP